MEGSDDAGDDLMVLYPSDLTYMTPDADGIVRLNRGTTKQVVIPFPSFVGDVRMFRGTADQVGKGDLLGWEIISEIDPNTYLRVATTDAEVGVVSGTNEYQPTGTVDLNHDHDGDTFSGGGGDTFGGGGFTTSTPVPGTRSVTDTPGVDQVDVSDIDHEHTESDHIHGVSTHFHGIADALADDTALTLDPLEITPQAISFYLIAYTGVIA